eukprot:4953388-Amphidinium_carterae.1
MLASYLAVMAHKGRLLREQHIQVKVAEGVDKSSTQPTRLCQDASHVAKCGLILVSITLHVPGLYRIGSLNRKRAIRLNAIACLVEDTITTIVLVVIFERCIKKEGRFWMQLPCHSHVACESKAN